MLLSHISVFSLSLHLSLLLPKSNEKMSLDKERKKEGREGGRELTSWNSMEVLSIGRGQVQTLDMVPYVISLKTENFFLPFIYSFK